MMFRVKNAVISDIILTFKQGFFTVYAVVCVIYIVVLNQLNPEMTVKILPIVIFSDPSVLGLFFIGGIILLEKQQGVISALNVTPLTTVEYMLGKIISLTIISILATIVICVFSIKQSINWFLLLLGVVGASVFFILIGVIIVSLSRSVNDFFIKMIPAMILFFLPCVILYMSKGFSIVSYFPGISGFKIIIDAVSEVTSRQQYFLLIYTLLTDIVLFFISKSFYEKRVVYGG